MTEKQGQEGREFTRIPMKMEAHVVAAAADSITSDHIRDVSMKGIYLVAEKAFPVGTVCDVVMLVGEPGSQLKIEAKGRVDRSSDAGMAIEFTEIGLESYDHLHNLVLYNSKNTDKVEQEFKDHLGLKRRE